MEWDFKLIKPMREAVGSGGTTSPPVPLIFMVKP